MATNAQILLGTTLTFNGETIGEVESAGGTFMTRNVTWVASADSTDGVAEGIAGTATPGTLDITCILDPTNLGAYHTLTAAAEAATEGAVVFTMPGTDIIGATKAHVSDVSQPTAGGPDDAIKCSFSLTNLDVGGWDYTDIA